MKRVEKLGDWRGTAERIATLVAPSKATDEVSLHGATGRVLAHPLMAAKPVPAFTHAVMDGFALGSRPPGQYRLVPNNPEHLALDEAFAVSSGQPLPAGAASVVLASRASADHERLAVTEAQAKDNIRREGEEAAKGAVLVKVGTRLDSRHVALAASAGIDRATVYARPSVGLLAVHESIAMLPHRAVFKALLESRALSFNDSGVTRQAALADVLERAATQQDLIIVVAESLGGEDGPLARAISAAGGEVSVLRAAMKPAKPIITGRVGGAIVLGFAGTAYATTVAAHLFLRPLLQRMAHLDPAEAFLPAVSDFERARQPGRAEALPARLAREDGRLIASSAGRFGQLSALAAMDGFALVDADAGDITQGGALLYHPLLMPLI